MTKLKNDSENKSTRAVSVRSDAKGVIEAPLIIVPGQVVFPQILTPLSIAGERNMAALEYARAANRTVICAVANARPLPDPLALEDLASVGSEVAVREVLEIGQSSSPLKTALVEGRRRVRIVEILQEQPFLRVRAQVLKDQPFEDPAEETRRLNDAVDLFQQIVDLNESIPDEIAEYIINLQDLGHLTDAIAATLDLSTEDRQAILSEIRLAARLDLVVARMQDVLSRLVTRDDVNQSVQQEIARAQREAYLREQMRVIQGELGEEDAFQQEINDLHARILAAGMPQETREKALKELSRLSMMTPMAPEASVVHTYLDWLISVPWRNASRDNLSLANAEKTLNDQHYGLEKVKERILEHIAVRKLAKDRMASPILCFVGPPGVGKTSMGRSIAQALGREFVRVSLGGVRDEAEIRGHRRTYIGALPGRIIQTMRRAGTINPVFMLDEIDKLSNDYRGDPAAALLEVLDPEQNNSFVDHYLEVPYDLSRVLFITTANELYPLPEALEDRMEIIEFRPYTEEEKIEIARRFLVPKQIKAHGLNKRGIRFQLDALQTIVREYTLEAGVRNLEREIANVCRKIARMVAMRKAYPRRITSRLVQKLLGPPEVIATRVNRQDQIGLVTGLVWTSGGGDIQVVEAALLPGKGNLTLTGQLGEVLQESAQAALSYARSRARDFQIPYEDFEDYDIHIHMPEGAVPKEGPSAGITLAVAILSALTERKVRADYAMTGEVTLRGHILPVGGIKEKVLAARRYKVFNIILPADNRKDLVDVPKAALRDMNIIFVDHMQQVLDLVLLEAPAKRQRDLENEEAEKAAKAEKRRNARKKKEASAETE